MYSFFEKNKIIKKNAIVGIQVNGKLRGQLEILPSWNEEEIFLQAVALESVAKWIEGKNIVNKIYKAGKIISLITD